MFVSDFLPVLVVDFLQMIWLICIYVFGSEAASGDSVDLQDFHRFNKRKIFL